VNVTAQERTFKHLDRANDVRLPRADLRKRLVTQPCLALGAICDPPDYMDTAKVDYLLSGVHRLGEKLIARYCEQAGVNPSTRLKDLTVKQRLALVEVLNGSKCFG